MYTLIKMLLNSLRKKVIKVVKMGIERMVMEFSNWSEG